MKKIIEIIVALLILIIALLALYRINSVRYSIVRAVWGVIDWASNKGADKAVLPEGVIIEPDLQYIDMGTSEQILDAYYPENKKEKLPVVIYIHGGGFVSGDKKQTKQYCMTLAKEGYVVFNINYRLAPHSRNFEQINDVLSAMKWVKENSNRYQGDDSKVIFAGDSAGAYLAGLSASISTNEELAAKLNLKPVFSEKEIRGVLLFSGVYDLETGSKTGFPSIKSDIEMLLGTDDIRGYKYLREFSVTGNITSKFPKTFISSGAIDWLHSESVELISTLDRNKVYHSELLFEKSKKKAMHNYQLRLDLDISKQCMKRALEFLEFVVK